jgi:dipeptidyl aminopeptidase/acylaminoacyl peptidase
VAYARVGGRVALADADENRLLWRSAPGIRPTSLAWSPGGRRLVALAPGYVWVLDAALRDRARTAMPAGTTAQAMAVHPGGRSVAVIRRAPGGRSEVVSIPLGGPGSERTLFAGQGSFSDLAWSPDGRWLLVAWREADQWLFIRSNRVRRIDAVRDIRRQFDPGGEDAGGFPRLGGWCCAPGR